jgi:hypothetical protein
MLSSHRQNGGIASAASLSEAGSVVTTVPERPTGAAVRAPSPPRRLPFDMTQFQPTQYEEEAEHEESMHISYEDPASKEARLRIMSQLAKSSGPPTVGGNDDGPGVKDGDEAPNGNEGEVVQVQDKEVDEPLKRIRKARRRR